MFSKFLIQISNYLYMTIFLIKIYMLIIGLDFKKINILEIILENIFIQIFLLD